MTNLEKAQQTIEREKPHWIEPHAIAIRFGLSRQVAESLLYTPGYCIKHKVYHRYCCEPPVDVFDEPVLPDEWECQECQEVVSEDDIYFEKVAVKKKESDRNV